MNPALEKFMKDQISIWPLASENYRSLKIVRTKRLEAGGMEVILQYNPCRKISSEAKLDTKSLSERPCFLCPENRPAEQSHIEFAGRKGRKYRITLNPYPIFPLHFVISSAEHTPQSIWNRFQDAIDFVRSNPDLVCFYNGPHSGASAPDHMHFQACPVGLMPLQKKADELLGNPETPHLQFLSSVREAKLYHMDVFTSGLFLLCGDTPKSLAKLFYRVLDCARIREGEKEPRINFILWHEGTQLRAVVIFREKHRSHHYGSTGADQLRMSPGCADMAGVFVAPQESDFEKFDSKMLSEVLGEVSIGRDDEDAIIWRLTRRQPKLEVGVMSGQEIEFEIIADGAGVQKASFREGKICYNGALYDELTFEAQTEATMFSEPSFILHGVTIGVGFHWERKLDQSFAGTLKIIVDEGKLVAVDIVGVEDYLLSVISSEMKATASLEFLKAHAVISRSWVMAQIEARRRSSDTKAEASPEPCSLPTLVTKLDTALSHDAAKDGNASSEVSEYVKWFDHDDHRLFDVCADDHCQRYQGLTMAGSQTVRDAIDQTWGLVLTSEGRICDARFSKCCGGISETFGTCWDDTEYPYLQSLPDTPGHDPDGEPFCKTSDSSILSQVLNDYDLETKDFFEWKTTYTRTRVSELIKMRSGFDFGEIRDLTPLARGGSGRIFKLLVSGTERKMVIGKELIIRKWLSESHLKSSLFNVRWEGDTLILEGKGWGHGVGLCQIGAAVMASRGYTFDQILEHYYPGTELKGTAR
jgi:SpoIID/LytB domain